MVMFPNCIRVDEESFILALRYFAKINKEDFKIIKYYPDGDKMIMEIPGFGAIIYNRDDQDAKIFLIMQNKALEFMSKN